MAETAEMGPPLPAIDEDSRPFWESCKRHAMAIQRCTGCGHMRFPPRSVCPKCLSDQAEWTPVSGRGTVYAPITFYHVYRPIWANEVPYNVSIVELAEGPRMWSNVIDIDPDAVQAGLPVQVTYVDVTDEVTLPKFRPA